jgi:hypothetical protein
VRRYTHLLEFVIQNFKAISVFMRPKGVVKREWQGQDRHGVCDGEVRGEVQSRYPLNKLTPMDRLCNTISLPPHCYYARGHL